MDFAPAWRPWAVAKCWRTAAPRAARNCPPDARTAGMPSMPAQIPPAIAAKPGCVQKPGRLKRRPEFLRVASSGKKAAVGGVVLQALARPDGEPPRLGFTVTKKVG